ncbi:hypothetical protein [Streptomyces sp. NBC_00059]|uniref:hypothetical protein n=1 Tax=Streptomyces sp. NBC_00059 TaxID=2975635 RepID=UPI0022564337|nr:hypothetical protein [Streptomyces sp. NBC_00059]MCX5412240.1 hypothetical protein [Streptomyces sp. NBC_00059]
MTAVQSSQRTGRSLVSDELFSSITEFVVSHFHQDWDRARLQTDQAIAFVATAAIASTPMVPSDDVDYAFHAFILHTKEYAEFCEQHGGRFIHHNPRPGDNGRSVGAVAASAHAMKAAGFQVFDGMWTVDGQNAAQCDSDDGRPYGTV